MNKLKMHSQDLIQENISKIRGLFPACVTEARDEVTGAVRLAVDFDQLRQELSDEIVEGHQERYRLDWPGKREALALSNAPISKTLRPIIDESVHFNETRNLFIQGDNLEALKLLQDAYLGQIDFIYIDPPYNTGTDFIYKDSYAVGADSFLRETGQRDDTGGRLVANPESNGRFHSAWLSMMYSRLRVAKFFLSERGVICISIDDDELDNLLKVTKEVFGEKNFVTNFLRQKKKKPSFLHGNVGSMYEYVVCLCRQRDQSPPFSVDVTTAGKKYPFNNAGNSLGILEFPAGSVYFAENSAGYSPEDMSEGNIVTRLLDPLRIENHTNVAPFRLEGEFRYGQARLDEIVKAGESITISKAPFRPNHIKSGGEIKKMHNHLSPATYDVGTNEDATAELEALFGICLFDNPKPTSLVRTLCKAVTYDQPEAKVLDFFAGSGTTAQSILELNAEDGGARQFILVQLDEVVPEDSKAKAAGYTTISELAQERIRRAGTKILKSKSHSNWNRDVGFRVFKVDTSNMKDVYYRPDEMMQTDVLEMVNNVKEDRSAEDLLFQVLVDWGVDLTLPIRRETLQDKVVFFVEDNTLIACFESDITESLVKEIASYEPLRVVFRDNGFVSDAVKINVEQIFRQLSPITELKAL